MLVVAVLAQLAARCSLLAARCSLSVAGTRPAHHWSNRSLSLSPSQYYWADDPDQAGEELPQGWFEEYDDQVGEYFYCQYDAQGQQVRNAIID